MCCRENFRNLKKCETHSEPFPFLYSAPPGTQLHRSNWRPSLEILKRLILSGDSPLVPYEKETARLNGNDDLLKGLVKGGPGIPFANGANLGRRQELCVKGGERVTGPMLGSFVQRR